MVVRASAAAKGRLAADRRAAGVATDRLTSPDTVDRAKPDLSAPGLRSAQRVRTSAATATRAAGINPDPAWDYKGLLWDYRRMGLPQGWRETAGSPKVTVAVADTGLDYTHSELAPKVAQVIDLTVLGATSRSARPLPVQWAFVSACWLVPLLGVPLLSRGWGWFWRRRPCHPRMVLWSLARPRLRVSLPAV